MAGTRSAEHRAARRGATHPFRTVDSSLVRTHTDRPGEQIPQATDDPFPDHWREFPAPWPSLDKDEPGTPVALVAAVEELPETWREVILLRDSLKRDGASVCERLELTGAQERAILNRARASVRHRLAQSLDRRGGG